MCIVYCVLYEHDIFDTFSHSILLPEHECANHKYKYIHDTCNIIFERFDSLSMTSVFTQVLTENNK